jgi:deoxyribose-phosphate aldolase
VKTSTGFAGRGASDEDVRLMRETVGPSVQVKASGGIRDLDTLLRFRALGATRIGTSATAAILDELEKRQ